MVYCYKGEMVMKIGSFEDMEYVIQYPSGYVEGKRYPVLLFLHGAGTRGADIELLKNNVVLPTLLTRGEEFSFIVVAPHCKSGTWFDYFERLKRFVQSVFAAPYTDKERLYVLGMSMGGYGTWQLAMSMPTYFAAIVPICGGGMYWNAGQLINVPVWAFHGEKDPTVFVEESKKMVSAINQRGGRARLTLYPEAMHDSWTATVQNQAVFEWLLSQRNQNSEEAKDELSGNQIYG